MSKHFILAAGSLLAAAPVAAHAQVGGALDMGQLTGTLSQDHVTQSERTRSGGTDEAASTSAQAARNCASVSKLKARYGADDPRIARIADLCRRAGHAVR